MIISGGQQRGLRLMRHIYHAVVLFLEILWYQKHIQIFKKYAAV